MSGTSFRFGAEHSYPLAHAGPDPRCTKSLVNSVAPLLVGYGYPCLATVDDWAALESALATFLYNPKEQ